MCLAVLGRITERDERDQGIVDLSGNRIPANLALVPEAAVGDYVLLHAGFAIRVLPEAEALETLCLLEELRRTGAGADAEGVFLADEPEASQK